MISLDNNTAIEIIDQLLQEKYQWRPLGGLFRRNRNNPQIYARDGRHVGLFGPFRINPGALLDPHKATRLQGEFEDFLKKVQRELENHIDALRPRALTIVFSGGGSLHVPGWFMDWCRMQGIQIVFAPDPQECCGGEGLLDYILRTRDLIEKLERSDPLLEERFREFRGRNHDF